MKLSCSADKYQCCTERLVAGVDEAGRGALAGPVVAGAVILKPDSCLSGLKDSKLLSSKQREELFKKIYDSALYLGVGMVNHRLVDRINVLQATMLAMKRAIRRIDIVPDVVLVDGNKAPLIKGYVFKTVVQGDKKVLSVSAASIIAKVVRDNIMNNFHVKYPEYQFNKNKGYGTNDHYQAIFDRGISSVHRKSFNLTKQQKLF
ncbi:MAG: ribonuclease HII [bacterium]|nr:ribonuclease HII [bacterium]